MKIVCPVFFARGTRDFFIPNIPPTTRGRTDLPASPCEAWRAGEGVWWRDFDISLLQLQQLGLPSGFRSSVQWLDNIYLTIIQYETKHPRGNHYAKKEYNR